MKKQNEMEKSSLGKFNEFSMSPASKEANWIAYN